MRWHRLVPELAIAADCPCVAPDGRGAGAGHLAVACSSPCSCSCRDGASSCRWNRLISVPPWLYDGIFDRLRPVLGGSRASTRRSRRQASPPARRHSRPRSRAVKTTGSARCGDAVTALDLAGTDRWSDRTSTEAPADNDQQKIMCPEQLRSPDAQLHRRTRRHLHSASLLARSSRRATLCTFYPRPRSPATPDGSEAFPADVARHLATSRTVGRAAA